MAIKRQAIIIAIDAATGENIETTLAFNISTNATYENLDTCMRAINALTTNTYNDTHIVNTVSLNEELAG